MSDNKKEEYIPKQLDDEEFEKEKARKKAEKGKKKNKVKKGKKSKVLPIILIIVVVAIVIVCGWFIYNMNRPENVVNDFAIYFNNQDWENVAESVDMKGYLTLTLIEAEEDNNNSENSNTTSENTTNTAENTANEAENVSQNTTENVANNEATNTTDESTEETFNYSSYDSKYNTVYDDLKNSAEYGTYYDSMMKVLDYGEKNKADCLKGLFDGSTITIEKIQSVNKIENTKSLYEVKLICNFNIGGNETPQNISIYVSKVDGKYKIVGGYFAYMVLYAYNYGYYYSGQVQ